MQGGYTAAAFGYKNPKRPLLRQMRIERIAREGSVEGKNEVQPGPVTDAGLSKGQQE